MKKNIKFLLSVALLATFVLAACGAPATEASAEGSFIVHDGGEVFTTVQITVMDGDLNQDGMQPVYAFSLSGFCNNEADEGGNEKLCQPVVTIETTVGTAAIFSGKPGEVTPLPLVNLDDYRAKGVVVQIVSEDVTSFYSVKEVVEMQTGIQLKLEPAQ